MLVVRALHDLPEQSIKKGDNFRLYIVDAHHHMGKEKSHKNSPPGAYEFYAQLWFELQRMTKEWLNNDMLLFEPVEVIPPDFPSRIFSCRENWSRFNHGWLVDRTVVFPYSDDYSTSDSPEVASFQVSNDRIAGWTTRAPHSSRLIGFCRVDPKDSEKGNPDLPLNELERAVGQLGLRGLKLHPLAQLFLDEIEDDMTGRIVKRAGEMGIPVIFDTRNMKTVVRIKSLIDALRTEERSRKALDKLKVIIAHCGMSPGDPKLYEVLRDPCIFGETSTLHGKDLPVLFDMARERIGTQETLWSDKLLFGTDYSFLSVQAVEVILYLLSKDFGGTLSDIQRILAGNSLILTQKPFRTCRGKPRPPKRVAVAGHSPEVLSDLEEHILSLITSEEWDLASLDFMLPPRHTWPQLRPLSADGYNGIHFDSYIVAMYSKSLEREIHLWVQQRSDNSVSCAVLGTKGANSLETTELATQRIGMDLSEILSKSEVMLESSDSLIEAVSRLVAFVG
ncbi:MAG: hypothetical protein EAX95_09535 [Candidatus Thorarchaeota archaeon]|nr:hypothetical protein [Candidatus Thorarchaeota archaeon]